MKNNLLFLSLMGLGSLCMAITASLEAQIVVSNISSSYTQNFNTLTTGNPAAGVYNWTDNSTLSGWYVQTTDNATGLATTTNYYRITNGNGMTPTNTSGKPTSVLAIRRDASDATLATVSTSSYVGILGVQFTNSTGSTISSITVSYTGEQWGYNTGGANTLNFTYSTNATSLTSGTWTDYNSLDFTALYSGNTSNQALDGNSALIFDGSSYVAKTAGQAGGAGALNYTTITATITGLSIVDGSTFWLKWTDTGVATGNGQALGIDDLNVSFAAIPEPSTFSLLALACLAALVFRRRRYLAT